MKGIELPINILVIVAIAVIVLIAVIAMFYPALLGGSGTVSLDVAKSQACRSLVAGYNCNTTASVLADIKVFNYDANGDGLQNQNNDTLQQLCAVRYQTASAIDCRKLCGC